MAALPVAMVTATILTGLGAWYSSSAYESEHDGIPTSSGIISVGTTVKLLDERQEQYKTSCLLDAGYGNKGTVVSVDKTNKTVRFRCKGKKGVTSEELPASALEVVFSTFGSKGIEILGGIAVPGAIVKLQNDTKKPNSDKALSNPFFESTGKVTAVLAQGGDKELLVKVERLDKGQNKEQYYPAKELELVSSPEDVNAGVGATKGLITIGTNVKLKENSFYKNSGKHLAQKEEFEPIGKVTAVRLNPKDTSKVDVVVTTKSKDKKFIGEDIYNRDDLEVVPKDKVPRGGVAVFGGLAIVDTKVKVREERKEAVTSKPLGRSAFGDIGTVTKLDPQSEDNLKVFVTCNGLNPEEQTGDWYQPEDLEIAEPDNEEGIPIFGGRATVGAFVAATEQAKGRKCLGKTQFGDVGVVKGIDPNGPNNLKINVVCGKDKNGKQSEWYEPTELKLYVPTEETGDGALGDALSKDAKAREEVRSFQYKLSAVQRDIKVVDDSAASLQRATAELKEKQDALKKVIADKGTSRQKRLAQEEVDAAEQWVNGATKANRSKQQWLSALKGINPLKPDEEGEYYKKLKETEKEYQDELERAKGRLQMAEQELNKARKSSASFQRIDEAYNSAKRNLELANIMKAQVYSLYSQVTTEVNCDKNLSDNTNAYKTFTNELIKSWQTKVINDDLRTVFTIEESPLNRIRYSEVYKSTLGRIRRYGAQITKLVNADYDSNEDVIVKYQNKIVPEQKLQEYVEKINNETDIFGEDTYEKLNPLVLEVYTRRTIFDNTESSELKTYFVGIDEEFQKLKDTVRDIELSAYLGDGPIETAIRKITKIINKLKIEKDGPEGKPEDGAEKKMKDAVNEHEKAFLKEAQCKQKIFNAQESLRKYIESKSKGPATGEDETDEKIQAISDAYNKYTIARKETLEKERDEKIALGKVTCLTQLINSGTAIQTKLKDDLNKRCEVVEMSDTLNTKFEELIDIRKKAFTAAQLSKDPCRGRDYSNITELKEQIDRVKKEPTKKTLEEFLEFLENFNESENVVQINEKIEEIRKFLKDLENPLVGGVIIRNPYIEQAESNILSGMKKINDKFIAENYNTIKNSALKNTDEYKAEIESRTRIRDRKDNFIDAKKFNDFIEELNSTANNFIRPGNDIAVPLTQSERITLFTRIFGGPIDKLSEQRKNRVLGIDTAEFGKSSYLGPAKGKTGISVDSGVITDKIEEDVTLPGTAEKEESETTSPVIGTKLEKTKSSVKSLADETAKSARERSREEARKSLEILKGFVPKPGSTSTPKIYFERQSDPLSCGRHAINNLVQKQIYDIKSTTPIDLDDPKFPINMIELCKKFTEKYAPMFGEGIDPFECKDSEDYNVETMIFALALAGFSNTGIDASEEKIKEVMDKVEGREEDEKDVYLLNLGASHWTSARKIGDKYYYFDSLSKEKSPTEFSNKNEFIENMKNIPSLERFMVFKEVGTPQDPIETYLKPFEVETETPVKTTSIFDGLFGTPVKTTSKVGPLDIYKNPIERPKAPVKPVETAEQQAARKKIAAKAAEDLAKGATAVSEAVKRKEEEKALAKAKALAEIREKVKAEEEKRKLEEKAETDRKREEAKKKAREESDRKREETKAEAEKRWSETIAEKNRKLAEDAAKGAEEYVGLAETAAKEVDTVGAEKALKVAKPLAEAASEYRRKVDAEASKISTEDPALASKAEDSASESARKVAEFVKIAKTKAREIFMLMKNTEEVVNLVYQCQTSGADIILNTVLRLTSEADSKIRKIKEDIEEVETIIRETSSLNTDADRKVNKFIEEAKLIDKCYNGEKERAETRYKAEKERADKALEEVKSKLFEVKQQNQQNNNNEGDRKYLEKLTLPELKDKLKEYEKQKTDNEDGGKPPTSGKKKKKYDTAVKRINLAKELIKEKEKGSSTPSGGNRRVTRRRPRY